MKKNKIILSKFVKRETLLSCLVLLFVACSSNDSTSATDEVKQNEEDSQIKYASITPNLNDFEVSGDTLFAIFQRYTPDEFGYATYNDKGLLALYNLKNESLLDTIQLFAKNPMSVKVFDGNVYVASQGEYNENWGTDADEKRGIEKINLKKKTSELWVSGKELGGGVFDFALNKKNGKAFASIYKSFGDVPLVEIDLEKKGVKKIEKITDAEGSISVNEDGLLFVGDRTENVVYTYDGKKINTIYDEKRGLPPYSIAFSQEETFVFVSDFSSGKLFWTENDDLVSDKVAIDFDSDSKIISADNKIYILERSNTGSFSQFDTKKKKVIWQKSANSGNPSDIVIYKDKLWVGMYNSPEIYIVSSEDGSTKKIIETKEFCAKE